MLHAYNFSCAGSVPNPCMLHETCMHACYMDVDNLHVTSAKINACFDLNYACNMHVTRFRVGSTQTVILAKLGYWRLVVEAKGFKKACYLDSSA